MLPLKKRSRNLGGFWNPDREPEDQLGHVRKPTLNTRNFPGLFSSSLDSERGPVVLKVLNHSE